eukprot:gene1201-biopygen15295
MRVLAHLLRCRVWREEVVCEVRRREELRVFLLIFLRRGRILSAGDSPLSRGTGRRPKTAARGWKLRGTPQFRRWRPIGPQDPTGASFPLALSTWPLLQRTVTFWIFGPPRGPRVIHKWTWDLGEPSFCGPLGHASPAGPVRRWALGPLDVGRPRLTENWGGCPKCY